MVDRKRKQRQKKTQDIKTIKQAPGTRHRAQLQTQSQTITDSPNRSEVQNAEDMSHRRETSKRKVGGCDGIV